MLLNLISSFQISVQMKSSRELLTSLGIPISLSENPFTVFRVGYWKSSCSSCKILHEWQKLDGLELESLQLHKLILSHRKVEFRDEKIYLKLFQSIWNNKILKIEYGSLYTSCVIVATFTCNELLDYKDFCILHCCNSDG